MDKRILKSGYIRLRFKLSDEALKIVHKAISQTKANYPNVGLDNICLDFIAGGNIEVPQKIASSGDQRFLVKLYPDQYETVSIALGIARKHVSNDETALLAICKAFVDSDKSYLK